MKNVKKLFSLQKSIAVLSAFLCLYSIHPTIASAVFIQIESDNSELFTIIDGTYLESYNGSDMKTVIVPDGIQVIGFGCFAGHEEICSVILPESLIEIEDFAFNNTGLTEITIPNSVQSIRTNVFMDCLSLENATLSNELRVLQESTFHGCKVLQSVVGGEKLEKIERYCFAGCYDLTELQLGNQIVDFSEKTFGGFGFLNHKSLMDAYRSNDGFVNLDGKYLAQYSGNEIAVFVPDGTRMLLADSLVKNNFVTLTLPDSVRYINERAIANCSRLMQLYLNDGLLSIGENALSGCDLLTTLVIPESVTYIGAQENCYLTDIYGISGTAAEIFANENGITFHDLTKPEPTGKDNSIIYGVDTWSIHNAGSEFNSEYYLTDAAREQLREIMVAHQDSPDGEWTGECYGLTVAMILIKAGVYTPSQIQLGANTVSEITSDRNVQSFLNYYHFTQDTAEMLALSSETKTDAQIMYRTIQAAKKVKNGGMPFLISLTLKNSGHAYVGYGQEDGEWEFDGKTYDGRILIWDPNFPTAPNENTYIYYDSLTFEYCIPYYNVGYTTGSVGPIKRICSDIDLLNMYPYPFTVSELAGDVNCDGELTIADAILLAHLIAEDPAAEIAIQGWKNADVNHNGVIQIMDLSMLLKIIKNDL